MSVTLTRRDLCKGIGAAGAVTLIGNRPAEGTTGRGRNQDSALAELSNTSSQKLLQENDNSYVEITTGDMIITFDLRYGSIAALKRNGDPFETNYIGNATNTPGVNPADSLWMGDVVTTVWALKNVGAWKNPGLGLNQTFKTSGAWKRESTGQSSDIRRVRFGGNALEVAYDGESRNDHGISSYKLTMSFHPGADKSLLWDISLQNTTGKVLEIGELGLPLFFNNDYAELFFQPGLKAGAGAANNAKFPKTPLFQKLIHEQKVFAHHFVAGHSSYSLVQRPLGDAPFLLVHPTMDTSFECVYRDRTSTFASNVRSWRGPEILAIHSRATQMRQRWMNNPWVNGHTSLLLQPGEAKSFQMRFVFVPGYDAIRDELYRTDNLGIRVMPSMVVQEGHDIWVDLKCKADPKEITFLSNNITIKDKKRTSDRTLLALSFKGRGQKSLKLHYGEGRWTNLHFYCVDDVEDLIKARGRFIAEQQVCQNPDDPYHRYHGFLPYDNRIGSTFLKSTGQVWEVGGSDEFGFSEPVFLAQKNVYFPSAPEIEVLESYVSDCLFKYIQNPTDYTVTASLDYEHRLPSSTWGDWDEQRSEATWRTYNYVHPVVIYHALYRIGKQYNLLKQRTADEYLKMAYHTAMKWFTTGPWKHVGLMEGSVAIDVLKDIKGEGWQQQYSNLLDQMKLCEQEFVENPYPYGSELMIDQTAHQQVYFFTRFFGDSAKRLKTVQVIKALRGGNQPVWFKYGNDLRGDMACWYTESLNGMALLDAFDESGDLDAFVKGYAGMMSVAANLLPDGMGFGWFISTPGIFAHEPPRTLDNGIGQWGFLKGAKAYVMHDEDLGLIGCGCRIEASGSKVRVFPRDGVRKRLRFVDERIDIDVRQGEIVSASLDKHNNEIVLQIGDSTRLVKDAKIEVRGLTDGLYKLAYGNSSRTARSTNGLSISVPMEDATNIRLNQRRD